MLLWAMLLLLDGPEPSGAPPAPTDLSALLRHRRKVKAAIARRYT